MSATSRRIAEVAHRARRAADRRQHGGDADPAEADRLRRRHRGAFADQVSRRPRHHARRRIVDSGRFAWAEQPQRFPTFNEPDPSYHGMVYAERFGPTAYIERARSVYQRTMGAVLSPFNAFLLLQGIETVALRVERHVENARKVAEFLQRRSARRLGQLRRLPGQSVLSRWCRSISTAAPRRCSPSASRAASKPARRSTTRSS